MFTFGFCAALGSAYFRYHDLAKIEEEEKKLKGEEELKEIDAKA